MVRPSRDLNPQPKPGTQPNSNQQPGTTHANPCRLIEVIPPTIAPTYSWLG
jgi:hypothetical protein